MRRSAHFLGLLAVVATSLFAGEVVDRDVLLTPDGTLYSVTSERVSSTSRVLKLTMQNGEDTSVSFVPTADSGYHSDPALAYDLDTRILFLFWQASPAPMTSGLRFCAYHNGKFSKPTEFASGIFRIQTNLRIGVTRFIDDQQTDGSVVRKRSSLIHAVWWEQTGYGESARYAIVVPDGGKFVVAELGDLINFVDNPSSEPEALPEDFNRDFLRQPAIFEQPGSESVEVLFSDWNTAKTYRVELMPRKRNGVLKPPIGRTRGRIGAPRAMSTDAARVSVLPGRPGSDSLIFYFESGNRLSYLMYTEGRWSDLKSISLNEVVTREVGINALRELLASE